MFFIVATLNARARAMPRRSPLMLQFAVGANGVHRSANLSINSASAGRRRGSRESEQRKAIDLLFQRKSPSRSYGAATGMGVCLAPYGESSVQP